MPTGKTDYSRAVSDRNNRYENGTDKRGSQCVKTV